MATQTQTKKAEAEQAMKEATLPRYHFLMRIVGGQGIDGVVQTGPELDQTVNDWLDKYDIAAVHHLGPFRDPSNTVLGHQFAFHLVLKEGVQ